MKKVLVVFCLCAGLLILAACASSSQQTGGGELTGNVWVVTELLGESILTDTGISIQFTSDGTLSGSSGCNQYNGKYTASGSTITINTPLATTMMACAQPVMDQESVYLKALGDAKSYTVKGSDLTLAGADSKTLINFEAQTQDLAGTNWEVIGYNNGKGAVTSVLLDTGITASFGQDGTLSGNAGCNNYSGSYSVTGNQIKIGPLISTMMACSEPDGIMDQEMQYLTAIQNAATYLVEGSVLELRMEDGALAADYNKK